MTRAVKATFAAGCFWHVEEMFRGTDGVLDARVGYTGGAVQDPTYEQVCTDRTGHAEAVQIEYDPDRVTYDQLLSVFWRNHDPTTPNRQGPDVGSQYRSAIFVHSEEQRIAAEISRRAVDASGRFGSPVVTQIADAPAFYVAEDYHQRYIEKQRLL